MNKVISVFVSRPTWVPAAFQPGLDGFLRVLGTLGFQPRTLGSTDYPSKAPLDEVIALMAQCRGAIILGYPQIIVTAGSVKDRPISAELFLPTEWNHIEAGLAYARGLPLLIIHHVGVNRGVFDRGALAGFLHALNLDDPGWPLRADVQGALVKWRTDVLGAPEVVGAAEIRSAAPPEATLPAGGSGHSRYCGNCGAVPGEPSKCNAPYAAHNFVPWRDNLYCKKCGAAPGHSLPCNAPYAAHQFETM